MVISAMNSPLSLVAFSATRQQRSLLQSYRLRLKPWEQGEDRPSLPHKQIFLTPPKKASAIGTSRIVSQLPDSDTTLVEHYPRWEESAERWLYQTEQLTKHRKTLWPIPRPRPFRRTIDKRSEIRQIRLEPGKSHTKVELLKRSSAPPPGAIRLIGCDSLICDSRDLISATLPRGAKRAG